MIFHKILTRRQWFSLILLTIGCMLKQLHFNNSTDETNVSQTTAGHLDINHDQSINQHLKKNTSGFDLSIDAVYIFIQLICSCLAGVYNEYLLKGDGANTNIYVQNIFMYLDSIVCNVALLILQGNLMTAFNATSLRSIFTFNVIIIIINNAAIGIVTSFFLRYLNSILKTFASALELLFTAILCYILFSIPIYLNTILSIAVVSFAIYLYSMSPVVNVINSTGKHAKSIEHKNALSYSRQQEQVKLLEDCTETV